MGLRQGDLSGQREDEKKEGYLGRHHFGYCCRWKNCARWLNVYWILTGSGRFVKVADEMSDEGCCRCIVEGE